MRRSRGVLLYGLVAICCGLFISACGASDQSAIGKVLDARDRAISSHDVAAYSSLIATDYRDDGRTKVDIVAQMINLFDHFDEVKMHSFDRNIQLNGDRHAECRQSYRLAVRSGKHWEKMVQREQLSLVRTPVGWKISGGL
ncbi:MAG TPA: hypothetical protein VJ961_04225 [Mariprofundaceae bacterium]|nr:hypothetical protein [Mariprofundaceae bacterium]